MGAIIFILSIIGSVGNTYYEKYIKVIPIEDKYFIDANKYNEKGEVIE